MSIFPYATGALEGCTSLSINPVYPIKIDRNTAIIISGVGASNGEAGIIGYTEEVTGA
jgi:hypothetical protein